MSHEKEELKWENILQVQLIEAKPNKMFSEDQRASIRFLRYSRAVKCAECGRKRKLHWTSLLSFKAIDMKTPSFVARSATNIVHPPLTPVCTDHPLALAEMPPVDLKTKAGEREAREAQA